MSSNVAVFLDLSEYDTGSWVEIPPNAPNLGPDWLKGWANKIAEAWLQDYEFPSVREGIDGLAETFEWCARTYPELHPGAQIFLHLREVSDVPMPVIIFDVDMEDSDNLRELTAADIPGVLADPVVQDFTTESLGTGLRVLGYRKAEDGVVLADLRYAWKSHEHGVTVVISTAWHDHAHVLSSIKDIDTLAAVAFFSSDFDE